MQMKTEKSFTMVNNYPQIVKEIICQKTAGNGAEKV